MVDRFLVWLGAEMVTAAVAAEMVAGAGVAVADSPLASDAKGTTSSESTKSTENKSDSGTDDASAPKPKPAGGEKPKEDASADPSGVEEDETVDKEPSVEQPDETPTTVKDSDTAEKLADQRKKPAAKEPKPAATPTAKQEPQEPNRQEYKADTKTTVKPLAPILPPNSTVTVRSSTLRIDCANGSEVPADW
jgi:outer membrane biosynthesis protein TonB